MKKLVRSTLIVLGTIKVADVTAKIVYAYSAGLHDGRKS